MDCLLGDPIRFNKTAEEEDTREMHTHLELVQRLQRLFGLALQNFAVLFGFDQFFAPQLEFVKEEQ